jgi:hypothetical protein
MNQVHVVALLSGGIVLVVMVEMLRRRRLREKYAALWLVTALGVAVFALFPRLLDVTADRLHVIDPVNLLLFAAMLLLLLVCIHLSWETSRLEDETRALAEEVALLRLQVERGARVE